MNFFLRSLLRKQDDFSETGLVLPRWKACESPIPYFMIQESALTYHTHWSNWSKGFSKFLLGKNFRQFSSPNSRYL